MMTSTLSLHRYDWSRKLNLDQLKLLKDRYPDLEQAPMATYATLEGTFGEPVRITWHALADQALVDALNSLDGEPTPGEALTPFDEAGQEATPTSTVPLDEAKRRAVAKQVQESMGAIGVGVSLDDDGVTTYAISLAGYTEVKLTQQNHESFDVDTLANTVMSLASAKINNPLVTQVAVENTQQIFPKIRSMLDRIDEASR